jgi:hypothetical protein
VGVVLTTTLTGCSGIVVKPKLSESGEQRYRIECSGEFLSWADCQAKADEVCLSKGYSVITSSLENQSLSIANVNSRSMTVSCRK